MIYLSQLFKNLQDDGIHIQLKGEDFDAAMLHHQSKKTPLIIQVLIFLGAFLSAGFFLGFLAATGIFDTQASLLVFGIVFTVMGLAIPYISKQEATAEPFALASIIVGHILIGGGLADWINFSFDSFLWVVFILEIAFFFIAASPVQKFLSWIAANLSFMGILATNDVIAGFNFLVILNAIPTTLLILKEPELITTSFRKVNKWYITLLATFATSLIIALMLSVNADFDRYAIDGVPWHWISSSVVLMGLTLWTLYETLKKIEGIQQANIILIVVAIGLLPMLKAPGIIAGILLLLLGMYSNFKAFAALGILAIFFFTGMFYYNLMTSLLIKSLLMLGSGGIFLAIGLGLRKLLPQQTKPINPKS
ncbi:MAG: DUF4401 domain-containing protein [Aureispira sp.]|nr:DUF4401 domain-containing protein [Aureispira sp.]